jgi:flagellar basal body-associated protein FliL
MLKIVLIGLWICIVSIGGVYLSVRMSEASATAAAAPPPVLPATIVRGNPISLPVINNGVVEGYFLGRISLSVDSEKSKKVLLPMDVVLTDSLFTLLMGDKMIDLKNVGAFDPESFRTKIKDGINAKLGDAVVANVMIEQLDYMSKDTIKINNARKGNNPVPAQKIIEGVVVETPAAAASH